MKVPLCLVMIFCLLSPVLEPAALAGSAASPAENAGPAPASVDRQASQGGGVPEAMVSTGKPGPTAANSSHTYLTQFDGSGAVDWGSGSSGGFRVNPGAPNQRGSNSGDSEQKIVFPSDSKDSESGATIIFDAENSDSGITITKDSKKTGPSLTIPIDPGKFDPSGIPPLDPDNPGIGGTLPINPGIPGTGPALPITPGKPSFGPARPDIPGKPSTGPTLPAGPGKPGPAVTLPATSGDPEIKIPGGTSTPEKAPFKPSSGSEVMTVTQTGNLGTYVDGVPSDRRGEGWAGARERLRNYNPPGAPLTLWKMRKIVDDWQRKKPETECPCPFPDTDVLQVATDFDKCFLTRFCEGQKPLEKKMAQVVGALKIGERFDCSGVLIGKDLVLTAGHCLLCPPEEMTFHLAADPEKALIVEDSHYMSASGEDCRQRDYALLILAEGSADPKGLVKFYDGDKSLEWSRVVVAGFNRVLCKMYQNCGGPPLPDSSFFRADLSETCMIALADGQFFCHSCQSMATGSGSAMFLYQEGEGPLVLVGLHTGALLPQCQGSFSFGCMDSDIQGKAVPNRGIFISQKDIVDLASRAEPLASLALSGPSPQGP